MKMSQTRSVSVVSGCRAPCGRRSHGSVTSTASSTRTRGVAVGFELDLADLEGLLDLSSGHADALAGLGLRRRRQRTDLAVGQRQRAAVTRVSEPYGLELVEVCGTLDRGQRLVPRSSDLVGVQRGHLDGVVAVLGADKAQASDMTSGPESTGVAARSARTFATPSSCSCGTGGLSIARDRVVLRDVRLQLRAGLPRRDQAVARLAAGVPHRVVEPLGVDDDLRAGGQRDPRLGRRVVLVLAQHHHASQGCP